jgi:hypothetical protein
MFDRNMIDHLGDAEAALVGRAVKPAFHFGSPLRVVIDPDLPPPNGVVHRDETTCSTSRSPRKAKDPFAQPYDQRTVPLRIPPCGLPL